MGGHKQQLGGARPPWPPRNDGTEVRRKLKFGENGFYGLPNILIYNENFNLNAQRSLTYDELLLSFCFKFSWSILKQKLKLYTTSPTFIIFSV